MTEDTTKMTHVMKRAHNKWPEFLAQALFKYVIDVTLMTPDQQRATNNVVIYITRMANSNVRAQRMLEKALCEQLLDMPLTRGHRDVVRARQRITR